MGSMIVQVMPLSQGTNTNELKPWERRVFRDVLAAFMLVPNPRAKNGLAPSVPRVFWRGLPRCPLSGVRRRVKLLHEHMWWSLPRAMWKFAASVYIKPRILLRRSQVTTRVEMVDDSGAARGTDDTGHSGDDASSSDDAEQLRQQRRAGIAEARRQRARQQASRVRICPICICSCTFCYSALWYVATCLHYTARVGLGAFALGSCGVAGSTISGAMQLLRVVGGVQSWWCICA
jgi:hypothetical protein